MCVLINGRSRAFCSSLSLIIKGNEMSLQGGEDVYGFRSWLDGRLPYFACYSKFDLVMQKRLYLNRLECLHHSWLGDAIVTHLLAGSTVPKAGKVLSWGSEGSDGSRGLLRLTPSRGNSERRVGDAPGTGAAHAERGGPSSWGTRSLCRSVSPLHEDVCVEAAVDFRPAASPEEWQGRRQTKVRTLRRRRSFLLSDLWRSEVQA